MSVFIRFVFLLIATFAPLCAQSNFEYWPGAAYDSRIPTFQKVLGHAPGEAITPHAGLIRYLEALEASAPGRIKIFEYAKSWQGRKLVYAVVGSEANIRRIPDIRAAMQQIADPRKTPEPEAKKLIANLPAVVWLGYGVHGDEISSPDAALLTAYHLLASRNDKMVEGILANTLVLIDPTQNPDGRDRFIHTFQENLGLEPDPSPLAAEHNQPWPGGRGNHYLFDLNRDWFALTQPESRGRVKALQEWFPLVFVDLHEMGSDSTYYFAPEAHPYNPHLAKDQRQSLEIFGRNNARWFDKFGFDYFTREVFDAFYPGYGASWPSYYGSVAMTYEQASVRGLVMRRLDETEFRFRDSVRQHFVASLATLEAAAGNREKLLNDFYRYRVTAIEEGSTEPVREYILTRANDPAAADKLASILVEQGVEVKRATAPFRAGDRQYPAGTYVVPLAQPSKRLIRTLLDPETPMDEAFVQEQERRRRRNLPDEIYDITAWSLPLMFNVEAVARPDTSAGSFEPVKAGTYEGGIKGKAALAYIVPWGSTASARLLAASLREGMRVFSSDKPFSLNGTRYPGGSLIIKTRDNGPDLHDRLARISKQTGAAVDPTDSAWVEDGVNFGSRYVVHLRRPAVAMAWDTPVSSTAAGWTRFVLERQLGYPVTTIRTRQLASADLSRFQVLILPSGGYTSTLGEEGARRLKAWVSAGGTLIGIGEAVAFLSDQKVGLLAVTPENLAGTKPEEKKTDLPPARVPGQIIASEEEYRKAIEAERRPPDSAKGVLAAVRIDDEHWLAAGVAPTVYAMTQGRSIYTPIRMDKGVNVAVYESADKLVASGYLWEENRKQLAFKPVAMVQSEGRGVVVAFTADPNFRAYMEGLNLLFANAVFRGPAHARPPATR